jgi:PAS domain S-box-containing protein
MTFWQDSVQSFSALPEIGPLLLSGDPAWIWARDGSRVLWANPAGAAKLGAERFAELWKRSWTPAHPLRRDIAALVRSLPERGSLARLRLTDALPAIPLACRCCRVRAGDYRGLLVVAVGAPALAPSAEDLARFLAGDAADAIVLENGDRREWPGGPDAMDAGLAVIEIATPSRRLRLALPKRELHTEAEPPIPPGAGAEPSATPTVGTERPQPHLVQDAIPPASEIVERSEAPPETEPRPSIESEPEAPAESDAPRRSPPRVIVVPQVGRRAAALPRPVARDGTAPELARVFLDAPAAARCEPQPVEPPPEPDPEPDAIPEPEAAPDPQADAPAPIEEEPPAPPPSVPVKLPIAAPAAEQRAVEGKPTRAMVAGRVPRELSRKPVRFLWQTDSADRFLFVSPGLAQVVGRNADVVGERVPDAAARLRLDPSQRIARVLAQRETWSGQTAWWPVEGSNVRVPAELTGLPVFGADRSFQGYRGFGVLKPAEALMPAAFEARFGPEGADAERAEQYPPYEEAVATVPANVVPIRADLERIAEQHMRLTPEERTAFEQIAAALRQRVEAEEPNEPPTEAAAPEQPIAEAPAPAEASETAAPERDEPEEPEPEAARELVSEATAPDEPPPATADLAQTAFPRGRMPLSRQGHLSNGEAQQRLREMTAILDTATDGVVILDRDGTIERANASAEALFGLGAEELQGKEFGELLTPESRILALDYLSQLDDNGVAALLNEGREVEALAGAGTIPLFMTMGRISGGPGARFCAVLRDITHWKRTEADLVAARRAAETASTQKSEFLARVSHEIRTPLNAIIGFAEVMIEERFGPIENERYREYLRDIRTSGEHVVSLVNDLLDISKIEAGKLDLTFDAVPLNDIVRESIALMQPQASRARVVLRSSLSRDVPAIVADQRTLRQIVLNLLSNSVKFTAPGGQVIASTRLAESGEALLRVRDTGEGMSEAELARALEPFRQITTAALADRTGTGLGLPLTKALVEANRASLSIRSARGEGTVVTVTFPATRVLSE